MAVFSLASCATEQARTAMLRPPPYLALTKAGEPAAVVRQSGYLAEQNGCLVFRPSSGAGDMTPVFQSGRTSLVTDGVDWLGLYMNDMPVAMGKSYRLSGASSAYREGPALVTPIPAGCPSRYFVVRTVDTMIADGDTSRFCAGVIICRSFGLD